MEECKELLYDYDWRCNYYDQRDVKSITVRVFVVFFCLCICKNNLFFYGEMIFPLMCWEIMIINWNCSTYEKQTHNCFKDISKVTEKQNREHLNWKVGGSCQKKIERWEDWICNDHRRQLLFKVMKINWSCTFYGIMRIISVSYNWYFYQFLNKNFYIEFIVYSLITNINIYL